MSISQFIGPRGKWSREGLEFRKPQMEMAEAVADAIHARAPLLIEAGTGVGKSIAYLLPAALAAAEEKIHVLVSTHTKALQEQLIQKDLPFLQDSLGREDLAFSFALFMGSENFLCLRRFNQAFRDSNALFEQPGLVANLTGLKSFLETHPAKTGEEGLRSRLPQTPEEVWRNVHRESDNCMSSHSPYYKACYHHAAQDRMKRADILVVNHALFFTNLAAAGRVLPPYDVVIFDEAHSIEEVAASHMGISVGNSSIRWQLDQIYHPAAEKGLTVRFAGLGPNWRRGAMELVKRLRTKNDAFFENIVSTVRRASAESAVRVRRPDIVPDAISQPLDELAEHLREGREGLEKPEDRQELKAAADRVASTAGKIRAFLTQEDRAMVYWMEVEERLGARGDRVTLKASPVDLSKVLGRTLFSEDSPAAILTSASLTVENDFSFLTSRIGGEKVNGIALGSPFDYHKQALLYLPEKMPDPAEGGRRKKPGARSQKPEENQENDKYYSAVLDQTRQLIDVSGGGAFVLCTSHDWVGRLFSDLSAGMPEFRFFKQEGAKSFTMLDEFRKTDRAVLIGTDTFWQGVDVPGEALRLVIVTRLPFARPTHPVEEARVEYLVRQGFDPFTRHTLPTAVLMLRQGVGRLIRRSDDRGVIAILDPRIRTRAYGQAFLKSLPPVKRTARLLDVKKFFGRSVNT